MPPQSRAAQGFAGAAVEIDLIRKGIMTAFSSSSHHAKRSRGNRPDSQRDYDLLGRVAYRGLLESRWK